MAIRDDTISPRGLGEIVLIGGGQSAYLVARLTQLGCAVVVVTNTSWDIGGRKPDLEPLLASGARAIPATDDPNPTTVVVAGMGELPAAEWVGQGRPGRRLAVRLAGNAKAHPDAVRALSRATATIIGPDDADLVVDPILKVLAQSGVRLPHPVIAVAHGHHRYEGTADIMVEIDGDPLSQAKAVLRQLGQRSESAVDRHQEHGAIR